MGLGLRRLDEIDLVEQFQRRPVMRSVPVVMSGSFKAAMRLAIDEVADGVAVHDEAKQERGWKFLLLPRMLLQGRREVHWCLSPSCWRASGGFQLGIG